MNNLSPQEEGKSFKDEANENEKSLADLALEEATLVQASLCLSQASSQRLEDLCYGPKKAFRLPPISPKRLRDLSRQIQAKARKTEGLGTIEIVIIIAVLLALALLFREKITAFAQELMDKVFDSSILGDL